MDATARSDPISELKRCYLFAELDTAQLERVVREVRMLRLDKSEVLFRQGDPAERFFLVRQGQIKLFRLSPEGNEKVIELIQPGQTFAEALMFSAARGYPVHAQAIEPSELYSFDNRGFKAVLRESVDTCFRLMAGMSMRLHQQVNEIDRLTLHSATYRLVSYLLQETTDSAGSEQHVDLPTTKSLIASRLSIQPETFSRILSRLSRDGLIDVQGTHIVLRDIPALRRLIALSSPSA